MGDNLRNRRQTGAMFASALATPSTCQAVFGCSWDTLQRKRLKLGLPLLRLGPQVPAIEVGPFLAALRAEALANAQRPPVVTDSGNLIGTEQTGAGIAVAAEDASGGDCRVKEKGTTPPVGDVLERTASSNLAELVRQKKAVGDGVPPDDVIARARAVLGLKLRGPE